MRRQIRRLSRHLPFLAALVLLTGCGLTQSVKNGTGSAARAIFLPKVETLHLQLAARSALNTDEAQMPSPVEVRLWPLRSAAAFSQAGYSALLKQDTQVLANDLSGTPVTVRALPGNTTAVDIPLADDVQAVAIAAFFLYPDMQQDSWRLILPRSSMDADRPSVIELNDRKLGIREQE
ncbi:type VI secretion system lipoprotein TssJ [Salmonella enterica subsp. enterica serovar Virchow]|nr:type VI secretion system lipoprotein TssJ [Salmonella enterica subsp. enterica serovar Virchow]